MCSTVATKRSRSSESSIESINKRTKSISVSPQVPSSPVDVSEEVYDDVSSTDSECSILVSRDLNLEVKLMQGSVNEMQTTVNMAAERIQELRALLTEYAESR